MQVPPFCRTILVVICLLTATVNSAAQSQANTGNIEGRVVDSNGASVPGVTVAVTNQETGFTKSVQSNDDGLYKILLLPPGRYKVEASAAKGFAPASFTNVVVTVGGQTPLDIQLSD
jgi:hypothetical protein